MDTQQFSGSPSWEKDHTTHTTSTVAKVPSPNDSSLSPRTTETNTPDLLLAQSFTLTIDEDGGQLSTGQTNNTAELSIPREIISTSDSSSILSIISSITIHDECVRPIIAGTYHGKPAYLVILQFQFETGSSQSMKSRVQNATISVFLEDAPVNKNADSGAPPAIVKTFPGPEGFGGPVSTAPVSTDREIGLQVGWNGLGANARWSQTRAREELGALKITAVRKGRHRDSLIVNMAEDPIRMAGIPSYLTIPLILTHHSRRFSMRVSLNAEFGFWRRSLAKIVPVLGGADEPLFFDPTVLQKMMETEETGIGGIKVVEWRDKLEEVDLKKYSSLVGDSD